MDCDKRPGVRKAMLFCAIVTTVPVGSSAKFVPSGLNCTLTEAMLAAVEVLITTKLTELLPRNVLAVPVVKAEFAVVTETALLTVVRAPLLMLRQAAVVLDTTERRQAAVVFETTASREPAVVCTTVDCSEAAVVFETTAIRQAAVVLDTTASREPAVV